MRAHLQTLVEQGVVTQGQADRRAELLQVKMGQGGRKGFHGFGFGHMYQGF